MFKITSPEQSSLLLHLLGLNRPKTVSINKLLGMISHGLVATQPEEDTGATIREKDTGRLVLSARNNKTLVVKLADLITRGGSGEPSGQSRGVPCGNGRAEAVLSAKERAEAEIARTIAGLKEALGCEVRPEADGLAVRLRVFVEM